MRLHMHAADVRHLVTRYFIDLGASLAEVSDIQENVRIDRGHCAARCYRVADMFAMWLIDIGIQRCAPVDIICCVGEFVIPQWSASDSLVRGMAVLTGCTSVLSGGKIMGGTCDHGKGSRGRQVNNDQNIWQ